MPKKTPSSIDSLVQRVAEGAVPDIPDLYNDALNADEDGSLWYELRQSIAAIKGLELGDQAPDDWFVDVTAALPTETLRDDLAGLLKRVDDLSYVSQHAAYLIGVAVGRRVNVSPRPGGVR